MLQNLVKVLRGHPAVPVIELRGSIGMNPQQISVRGVSQQLQRANFYSRNMKAVALLVNSPGGAAAQSHLIAKRIRAFADEKKVPVLAFCEDVAASGGYFLASAADEIYADEFSLIGSIGVITGGFGFVEAMKKLGVERRVYAAGENKGMLDPFREENPQDVARLRVLLGDAHSAFVDYVKRRRGEKLNKASAAADPDLRRTLFEGNVFSARQAHELGLIDGIGDISSTLKSRFGQDVMQPLIRRREGPFGLSGSLASSAGLATSSSIDAIEEAALWRRYGF